MRLFYRGRQSFVMAFLSIIISIAYLAGVVHASTLSVGGDDVYIPESTVMEEFTDMTNQLRQDKGLSILEPSENLEESAKAKLADMDTKEYWGHYGPNNGSFSRFIWEQDPKALAVGENLARCFSGYKEAFVGLVNSPTHYAVLTGSFTKVGIASEITDYGCESIVMHFSN